MFLDYDRLRRDLEDDYGAAAFGGFPAAFMDIQDVEDADEEELEALAEEIGIDLREYRK